MTLHRVPDGSVPTADPTSADRVTFVDDPLGRTFDPPTSRNESDLLGRVRSGPVERVVVADRLLMRHPVNGPATRAFLARHGIEPHFVLLTAGRASQQPAHEGDPR